MTDFYDLNILIGGRGGGVVVASNCSSSPPTQRGDLTTLQGMAADIPHPRHGL